MSSNGGRLVSIEIMRQPPPGTAEISVLFDSSSRLSWFAGGLRSPAARFSPLRMRRVATAMSSLPA